MAITLRRSPATRSQSIPTRQTSTAYTRPAKACNVQVGEREGSKNTASKVVVAAARILCQSLMEPKRELFKHRGTLETQMAERFPNGIR